MAIRRAGAEPLDDQGRAQIPQTLCARYPAPDPSGYPPRTELTIQSRS